MYIKPCPICGSKPQVDECVSLDNRTRRRLCMCPNRCSVIFNRDSLPKPWFTVLGSGDRDMVLRIWNKFVDRYNDIKDGNMSTTNLWEFPIDESVEDD